MIVMAKGMQFSVALFRRETGGGRRNRKTLIGEARKAWQAGPRAAEPNATMSLKCNDVPAKTFFSYLPMPFLPGIVTDWRQQQPSKRRIAEAAAAAAVAAAAAAAWVQVGHLKNEYEIALKN
jgi:hypothetical protein